MENSEALDAPLETPGERLRQAREQAGISPREMADRLNWLPAHVGVIENNEFDSLRGPAFVRGYLRAYARALGLDEDEMVELYDAEEPAAAGDAVVLGNGSNSTEPGSSTTAWIVVCLVLAVVVVAAIWGKQQRGQPVEPAPAAPVTERPAPAEPAPEIPQPVSAPAAEAIVDSPPEVTRDDSTVDSNIETTLPEPAEESSIPEPADDIGSDRVPQALDPVEAVAPTGGETAVLEFSFSGDCWLEVRDGAGQLIYADLRVAGETLRLNGAPPFDILAGDAAALTLTFRGEPVQVQTRPGRDTARFTVGAP